MVGRWARRPRSSWNDAYLTGWIVVGFEPGGLTAAQRDEFEYWIGCTDTWAGEDGRNC